MDVSSESVPWVGVDSTETDSGFQLGSLSLARTPGALTVREVSRAIDQVSLATTGGSFGLGARVWLRTVTPPGVTTTASAASIVSTPG